MKPGGGIEEKGKKYILQIKTREDLARDILKSDMASIKIPEFDWDIGMGCIAGKFTTLEGILKDLKTELIDKNPFASGDSAVHEGRKERFDQFKADIEKLLNLEMDATFELDDPSGNSYILRWAKSQLIFYIGCSLTAPEPDPQLQEIIYERTWEQNEELGLNDMKTENYSEQPKELFWGFRQNTR